jgi:hypothetical protein
MSVIVLISSALPLKADVTAVGRESPKMTQSGSRGLPIRDTLPEGFSHFVTSITAPVASGWSDRRVGLAPTGKTPPYHGAHAKRTLAGNAVVSGRICAQSIHPISGRFETGVLWDCVI